LTVTPGFVAWLTNTNECSLFVQLVSYSEVKVKPVKPSRALHASYIIKASLREL